MTKDVFRITHADPDSRARSGVLTTAHGTVETPVFMPVATQGSVKALSQEDLTSLGVRAILSNSYHLYLRPGAEVVEAAGGLHSFMDYDGTILTDSGGYQVFSLSGMRQVDDEGVTFQSHLDGSSHRLTPESVVRLQARLGSDIWTTLDECPPYPCSPEEARTALKRTMRWTDRSVPVVAEENAKRSAPALFFPIVQGSMSAELRSRAAAHLADVPHDGFSLGGFSVGETKDLTWTTLAETTALLPAPKPRYLMGMGAPEDLWEAVGLGVDMMDCVWPTRIARNGQVMTADGRLNIKNTPFRTDQGPLDPDCPCTVCARYSRSYLSHLFRAKELSSFRLLTIHNLTFTLGIMNRIRESLRAGTFIKEKKAFLDRYLGKSGNN